MKMFMDPDGQFWYRLTLRECADHSATLATLSEENANLKAMLKSLSDHVAVPATATTPKSRKATKAKRVSKTQKPGPKLRTGRKAKPANKAVKSTKPRRKLKNKHTVEVPKPAAKAAK